MAQKELSKYEIIKNLIDKKINGTQAAKQIGLSVRQVKRLKTRVEEDGPKGIIHRSRERKSNQEINPKTIEEAKHYLQTIYSDFKPTFAMEKLEKNHNIKLSKEKVRQIMIEIGLWKPRARKKNKEYRSWRQRKDYYGNKRGA